MFQISHLQGNSFSEDMSGSTPSQLSEQSDVCILTRD